MRNLSKREGIIFIVTIAIIGVYGIFSLVVKPWLESAQDIDDQITAAEQKLGKQYKILAEARNKEKHYVKMVEAIGKVSSDAQEISSITNSLEKTSRQVGVKIANMQPQRPSNRGDFVVFAVDMILEGEWSKVVRFLYEIQNQPNSFSIIELNLEKYSDTTNVLRGRIVVSKIKASL